MANEAPKFEVLDPNEQVRIYKDRLKGIESTIAVETVNVTAGDPGAEDRLATEQARADAVKELIASAEAQRDTKGEEVRLVNDNKE
jgi:hypothetical protein